MDRPYSPPETFADLHFPRAGLDFTAPFASQPNRLLDQKTNDYARTATVGVNVRGLEAVTQRDRGGARPGIQKYVPQVVVAGWLIQELNVIAGTGYSPPGGTVQTSQSGRVVTVVAVSQGNVYVANAGDTAWTTATNSTAETPPLNFTGIVYSTSLNQKLWFADGTNWCYYDPSLNQVKTWTAVKGTLPADSDSNAPRLICTWRGRIVVSGLLKDPQNWFMSRMFDPTDWNYFPVTADVPPIPNITPDQPVAGNNSPAGLVGDVVTALVPYSDDVLIFGGDHTLYQMSGDPMSGGNIDRISDEIGMAWGNAWCKDPFGTLYFFSNRTGIYAMSPGQKPMRISQAIEQLVLPINTGENNIRLIWDDRWQGLHVFITPLAAPTATSHFFWEARTNAWWEEEFANHNHDPMAACVFDGNDPSDRCILLGSWDGYVRTFNLDAVDDDGTPIASEVIIGPIGTKDLDDVLVKDLQCVLGETSGTVNFSIHVGASAEKALSSEAVASGTWGPGRNLLSYIRRSGHAIWVRIYSNNLWAMENIRVRVSSSGKVRRRGR